jgi:hypothetical protein
MLEILHFSPGTVVGLDRYASILKASPCIAFSMASDTLVQIFAKYTNGALRCRRDYRKHENNVEKILLHLFPDLGVN